MKIVFEGSTMAEVHSKVIEAAIELKNMEVGGTPITTMESPAYDVEPAALTPVKFDINPEGTLRTQAVADGVDSRGLPWDARIHSSNKEKNEKSGEWRRRRGVSPEIEAQVEAELRGEAGKKAPPFGSMTTEQYQQVVAPVVPAPMPTTEFRQPLPEVSNVLAQAQIPEQAPIAFTPPPVAQVLPPNTYNQESFRNSLVVILNDLVVSGKIDHNWVNTQKTMFGGKDVVQWYENQAACNQLFDAFVSWGFINKL